MSSKGGGRTGGGDAEGSRVSIPDNARKTIQNIREITGKQHSHEEIYAILEECSMDPNETAQKLLYMDTFHDAKRKRDKKKEASVIFLSSGEIQLLVISSILSTHAGTQGRGGQSTRGNYYSSSVKDVGGGRNSFARRENGVNHSADRGSIPSKVSQKVKKNAPPHMTKTPTAIPNGTTSLPNGSSSHGLGLQLSVDGIVSETKGGLPVNKTTTISAQTVVREPPASIPAQSFSSVIKGQEKSASNLNALSTSSTSTPSVVSSSAYEPGMASTVSQHAGALDTIKREAGSQQEGTESSHIQVNKLAPCDIDVSKTEKMVTEVPFSMNGKEEPRKSKIAEQAKQSKPVEQVVISEVATVTGKPGVDDTAGEPASSQGILPAPPEFVKAPESDCTVSSDADLNVDQSNQEMHLHPESNQSIIPNVPSYGLSFMSASATHPAQFDGPDARTHDVSRLTNLVSGNSPAPSGCSTPPIQNSVAAAPQTIKPGTNAGNPAHLAIPSGYGRLASPPIGFNIPVPSVTSGSSSSKENIAALQLKEHHIYTTGPLNEGSALWMPAEGQDLSNLQVNSLYNLSLHSQRLPFSPSQAGHGAFAGLYQSPPQTMAPPSNINTLLQQSQSMAAAVGTVGPPTGPYEQPQLARVNW
ncbi:GBF-interacting protein 1 [Hibiscus syriacus]|uniref:GBF-interacting protein 1 n=1 Tax=Hibiscus syriacus TaxID=106335 RepID=A0A6A3CWN8_HIBSY|nr:GBF-interacting protein 1 [Hibiscus syriacus]